MDSAALPKTFSPSRKADLLHLWRMVDDAYKTSLLKTYGATEYEVTQWARLERKYGKQGLMINDENGGIYLHEMRVVPRPQFYFRPEFSICPKCPRVTAIKDALGFPIEFGDCSGQEMLFYLAVRSQTALAGICTYPDLAHMLWPAEMARLPQSKIIDVLVNKTNKAIAPERIQSIRGRGYRLITSTAPA